MRTRLALAILATFLVTACSGGSDDDAGGGGDTAGLADRLVAAQAQIDAAERLDLSISTTSLPAGVTGLKSATGVGDHTPAFSGDAVVSAAGAEVDAEIIAVGGVVYVKTLLFGADFQQVDPATIGAPDPAALLGTDGGGISSILSATEPTDSDRSRDGKDVLTSISGTIDGSVIARYLPSADADGTFAVTYRLDDDDVLRDAKISGPFYRRSDDVTYTLTLAPSTSSVEIVAP